MTLICLVPGLLWSQGPEGNVVNLIKTMAVIDDPGNSIAHARAQRSPSPVAKLRLEGYFNVVFCFY